MKPEYSKAAISELSASPNGEELTVRYRYPPESLYYSGGVNVTRDDGAIRLVIARCKVDDACAPDVPTRLAKPDQFQVEVGIPWKGERVVLVHSDGEQQISP